MTICYEIWVQGHALHCHCGEKTTVSDVQSDLSGQDIQPSQIEEMLIHYCSCCFETNINLGSMAVTTYFLFSLFFSILPWLSVDFINLRSDQYASPHPSAGSRINITQRTYHSVPADHNPSPVTVLFKTSRRSTFADLSEAEFEFTTVKTRKHPLIKRGLKRRLRC